MIKQLSSNKPITIHIIIHSWPCNARLKNGGRVLFLPSLLSYAFVVIIMIEQDYTIVLYKLVLIRNKGVKGSYPSVFVKTGRRRGVSKITIGVNR